MPPVPSLTQAFSALTKPIAYTAPKSYASLAPPAPVSAPARPNLFSSIGSFFSDAYNRGGQILSQTTPSVPRIGVSSPAALAAAAPQGGQAPNATSAATGKPTYIPPTPAVPQVDKTPNATSAVTGKPVYGPEAPQFPNATSVATKQPVYGPSAPAVPQTFAEPVTAPSGTKVDPNTGGVVAPAAAPAAPTLPQAPAAPLAIANTGNAAGASDYSGAAGGAPGGASAPGAAPGGPARPSIEDAYLESLKPTKEEDEAQKRLDELAGAAGISGANIQNQSIAMPFITGQLAAVERSRAAQAAPVAAQLARLQAKRQIALDASKAALEIEQKKAELGKPVSVGFGETLVDPRTGKPIGGGAFGGKDAETTASWVNLIKGGQAQLSDVPQQLRQGVAEGLSGSTQISKASQDAIAQADTVIQKVDEIVPTIDWTNTGAASYLSMVKGTPQYNLAAQLDTIKANVGFAALQAMRAASPTGGALGQVSEQENRLLQSTLASLDQGQGADQLKANLAKVKLHFENLKQILNAPIGAQVDYDKSGKVIVSGGKGGATTDVASEGWF